MKKFIVLILSILYITTSSGATLHVHYCMGKLAGLDLWEKEAGKCGKCGMKKSARAGKNCCSDQKQKVKGEKDQKLVNTSVNQILQAGEAVNASYAVLPDVYVTSPALENPRSNAPPFSSKVGYYILNCTFRI